MNLSKLAQILFSKALMLTYIFVGYLSLVVIENPTCVVESIPEYSANDNGYPAFQSFHISMNEHVRSYKVIPANKDFVTDDLAVIYINAAYLTPVYDIEIPSASPQDYYSHSSRAPPSKI